MPYIAFSMFKFVYDGNDLKSTMLNNDPALRKDFPLSFQIEIHTTFVLGNIQEGNNDQPWVNNGNGKYVCCNQISFSINQDRYLSRGNPFKTMWKYIGKPNGLQTARTVITFDNIPINDSFIDQAVSIVVHPNSDEKYKYLSWKYRILNHYDAKDALEKVFSELEFKPKGAKSFRLNNETEFEQLQTTQVSLTLLPTWYSNYMTGMRYNSYIPKQTDFKILKSDVAMANQTNTELEFVMSVNREFLRFDSLQVMTTYGQAMNYTLFVLIMSLPIVKLLKSVSG